MGWFWEPKSVTTSDVQILTDESCQTDPKCMELRSLYIENRLKEQQMINSIPKWLYYVILLLRPELDSRNRHNRPSHHY